MGHGCSEKRPSGAEKLICHLLLPYVLFRRFCLRYRVLSKSSRCLRFEKGSPSTRRPVGSRNFAKQQVTPQNSNWRPFSTYKVMSYDKHVHATMYVRTCTGPWYFIPRRPRPYIRFHKIPQRSARSSHSTALID